MMREKWRVLPPGMIEISKRGICMQAGIIAVVVHSHALAPPGSAVCCETSSDEKE